MRHSTIVAEGIAKGKTVAQGIADALYPYSVQMKGTKWRVFDGRTGGFSSVGFDKYADAERKAWEFKNAEGKGDDHV